MVQSKNTDTSISYFDRHPWLLQNDITNKSNFKVSRFNQWIFVCCEANEILNNNPCIYSKN